MAKKKDEKDVLVVRDEKTGEISVVAGLNADGTPKRTPAKAENAQSFLQFDRHGDVLDNFFKNFFRQCKEPSAPASVPEQTNPRTAQNRHLPLSTAGDGRASCATDRETRTSKTGEHGTTERTATGQFRTDAGQTGLPAHRRE